MSIHQTPGALPLVPWSSGMHWSVDHALRSTTLGSNLSDPKGTNQFKATRCSLSISLPILSTLPAKVRSSMSAHFSAVLCVVQNSAIQKFSYDMITSPANIHRQCWDLLQCITAVEGVHGPVAKRDQ